MTVGDGESSSSVAEPMRELGTIGHTSFVRRSIVTTIKGGLGAVPVVGPLAVEVINATGARAAERKQLVVVAAVHALGRDLEDLRDLLQDDDELAELRLRGLKAAEHTRNERKLFAFAEILSGAVDADASERLAGKAFVRVLEELDEEHIQLMVVVERGVQTARETGATGGKAGVDSDILLSKLPQLAPVFKLVLSTVLSLGLAENTKAGTWDGIGGGESLVLTDLGRDLLELLRDQDQDPVSSPTDPS